MTPDVLSQNEIDSLLNALSNGSVDINTVANDSKMEEWEKLKAM